jgi:putative transposase
MLKEQGQSPKWVITDQLKSYDAARREVVPSVVHCQKRRANNGAEASQQHTRQHELQMRCFISTGQVQQLLAVHSSP